MEKPRSPENCVGEESSDFMVAKLDRTQRGRLLDASAFHA